MDVHQATQPSRNGPIRALVATLNYAASPPLNALVFRKDWITMIPPELWRLNVAFDSVGPRKSYKYLKDTVPTALA